MARKQILPRKVRVEEKQPPRAKPVRVDISKETRPKAKRESGRDLIERGLDITSLL